MEFRGPKANSNRVEEPTVMDDERVAFVVTTWRSVNQHRLK
jgi:hypothetical protein